MNQQKQKIKKKLKKKKRTKIKIWDKWEKGAALQSSRKVLLEILANYTIIENIPIRLLIYLSSILIHLALGIFFGKEIGENIALD